VEGNVLLLDGGTSSAISQSPYWWDARDRGQDEPLPSGVADVAIIGSGYTGLSAALRLARAGTKVLVVEAGELGEGGSTRNGGMVSGTLKVSHPALVKSFGKEKADSLFFEAQNSVLFLENQITAGVSPLSPGGCIRRGITPVSCEPAVKRACSSLRAAASKP
jgi:glycine/D-amino acid oxidase-like deaminating enzyme